MAQQIGYSRPRVGNGTRRGINSSSGEEYRSGYSSQKAQRRDVLARYPHPKVDAGLRAVHAAHHTHYLTCVHRIAGGNDSLYRFETRQNSVAVIDRQDGTIDHHPGEMDHSVSWSVDRSIGSDSNINAAVPGTIRGRRCNELPDYAVRRIARPVPLWVGRVRKRQRKGVHGSDECARDADQQMIHYRRHVHMHQFASRAGTLGRRNRVGG